VLGTGGHPPQPNACTGRSCSDIGDGESECTTGPNDKTCSGLVRANGRGILSCANNNDCTANHPLNGACTLVQRRACFLEQIVAAGVAGPSFRWSATNQARTRRHRRLHAAIGFDDALLELDARSVENHDPRVAAAGDAAAGDLGFAAESYAHAVAVG